MIAVIDIHIQAANPCMPLYPWRAFVGSPSSLRVRNVPKKIGTWQITSVDVQVEYPDNTVLRQPTKLVGGVWVATLVGSSSSGMTKNGYTIVASGIDENGDVVSDYILGKGDVEILNTDSIVEAGIKVNTVKIFEEQPEEPKDGDMWFNGNQYVIYDKGKITVLGGFEPTEAQQEALDSGITASKVANYTNVYNKVPAQTFENDNMLADKAFVNSSVQTATANFRGNWETFEAIPTDTNLYPEDYAGNKIPTTNDYLVVENYTLTETNTEIRREDNDSIVATVIDFNPETLTLTIDYQGEQKTAKAEFYYDYYEIMIPLNTDENLMGFCDAQKDITKLSSWTLSIEETYNSYRCYLVEDTSTQALGTWRFKYVGTWDVDGKDGWRPEYQVNETPMTADQLAALNSGITASKVDSFITNAEFESATQTFLPRYDYYQLTGDINALLGVTPYRVNSWIANTYQEVNIVDMPDNEDGKMRESIVVIDASNFVPKIIWTNKDHPRTDAATDFVCEVGINVYWISEYMPNRFVVARWLETAGGNGV